MSKLAFSRPAASLWVRGANMPPPSQAVIDAVVDLGDLHEDREDGLLGVRLSFSQAQSVELKRRLGEDWPRALDICVLWDEREDEIAGVIDFGPMRAAAEAGPTGNRYADARMRGFPRAEPTPRHAVAA